jgi:hypothetical protein
MLDAVFNFVQSHPQEVTLAFAVITALWVASSFFLKHRHEKDLKRLEHSLTLERTKRGSLYASKAASYERYAKMLDDFGAKHQTALVARMEPIFAKYVTQMLEVQAGGGNGHATAVATYVRDVMLVFDEAQRDFLKLKSESRALRLTASDKLVQFFDELEQLVEKSVIDSRTLIGEIPNLAMSDDPNILQQRLSELSLASSEIHNKSQELHRQMRIDLTEI